MNYLYKLIKIIAGASIIAGFILALGLVGADDYATATGVYTSVSHLAIRLMGCLLMIASGMVVLNYFK